MLVLLMGAIHEVQRLGDLRWHDIHTRFHTDWLRMKFVGGDKHNYRHTGSKMIS
jgi:hypothetical protein